MLYKNDRQMEFSRLMEQLEAKGLRPADAARLLKVSKATVSKILDGKQTPREPTLDSFRRIVAEQCGANPPALKPDKACAELNFLKVHYPAGYDAASKMISVLRDQAVNSDPALLAVEAEAERTSKEQLGRGLPGPHDVPPAPVKKPAK